MRYPMWRRNSDGSEEIVTNQAEAYSDPETIAAFLPNKPIPDDFVPSEPEEGSTEPESEDDEVQPEEGSTEPRKRGRPKKVVA